MFAKKVKKKQNEISNEQQFLLKELTTENIDRTKLCSNTGWISVLAKKLFRLRHQNTKNILLPPNFF